MIYLAFNETNNFQNILTFSYTFIYTIQLLLVIDHEKVNKIYKLLSDLDKQDTISH